MGLCWEARAGRTGPKRSKRESESAPLPCAAASGAPPRAASGTQKGNARRFCKFASPVIRVWASAQRLTRALCMSVCSLCTDSETDYKLKWKADHDDQAHDDERDEEGDGAEEPAEDAQEAHVCRQEVYFSALVSAAYQTINYGTNT